MLNLSAHNTACGDDKELFVPEVSLASDAFPSLQSLSFSAPSLNDSTLLLKPTALWSQSVSYLWLHLEATPKATEITKYLDALAGAFLSLYTLTLGFHKMIYLADEEDEFNGIAQLRLHDLLPLLRLKGLAEISITHP